jgi:hypothetical protein
MRIEGKLGCANTSAACGLIPETLRSVDLYALSVALKNSEDNNAGFGYIVLDCSESCDPGERRKSFAFNYGLTSQGQCGRINTPT